MNILSLNTRSLWKAEREKFLKTRSYFEPVLSQRPAPTTIPSRSPFPLSLCSCSTSLSKGTRGTRGNGDICEAPLILSIIPTILVSLSFFIFRFLQTGSIPLAATITTQARHDFEKLAVTGLELASQDRSSQQSSALTVRPNGLLFDLTLTTPL